MKAITLLIVSFIVSALPTWFRAFFHFWGFFELKDLTNRRSRCTWLRVDAQYHSPSLPRSVPDVHQLWRARNPKTRLMNSICCSVSIETSFDPCCVRQKAAASSQVMKPSVWKSRQPMLAREPSTQELWQGPFQMLAKKYRL